MGNKIDRREFLSLMGLGGAAAATLSCGSGPDFDETWHPWVEPVEGSIPYIPNYYATTTHESDGMGLYVKVVDGRTQKLDGNPEHPLSMGGITARHQSAVQDLYGAGRLRMPTLAPVLDENGKVKEAGKELTWPQAKKMLNEKLTAAKGSNVSALTGPYTGSLNEIWTRFVQEMGTGKVVQYSAYSQAALLTASEKVFGIQAVPLVTLKGADMVLSLGAQFLESWGDVAANTRHYANMRTVDHGKRGIHVQVEAKTTGTGANADMLIAANPGSETMLALALLKQLAANSSHLNADEKAKVGSMTADVSVEAAAAATGVKADAITHLVTAIQHQKAAVILPAEDLALGKDAVTHHAAVLLLNKAIGSIGRAYNYAAAKPMSAVPNHQGVADLIKDLQGGSVDVLFVRGTNPAYSLPKSAGFAEAVQKAGFTVAFASKLDETVVHADLIIPCTHDLESWGEINTYAGMDQLMQPTMQTRWDCPQAEDILLESMGETAPNPSYHEFLKASWQTRLGGSWREDLGRGGRFAIAAGSDMPISGNLDAGMFANVKAAAVGSLALVIVDSARFGDGSTADRGWMQELPDTMTGVVWDSFLEISSHKAAELDLTYGDVVKLEADGYSVEVPVFLAETISDNVVTLATGLGRSVVQPTYDRGVNAFSFRNADLDDAGCYTVGVKSAKLTKTGKTETMATPHVPGKGDRINTPLSMTEGVDHHYDRDLFQSIAIGSLGAHGDDHHGGGGHHETHDPNSKFPLHKDKDFYPDRTDTKLYEDRDETFYDNYKWELAIDLNQCTGCGSCVTACYAENNIAVVGRDQVARGREMSWVRINRYLSFTEKDGHRSVGTHMMPMMCQQCGNAPCESVCPSLATYHTKEGINAMVYNRCVGTRYCSNNCSYKVRRFNWFTYTYEGDMKWQMNPAVTVRQKGVMEKCNFCAHRNRAAKSLARDLEKDGKVKDGQVTTACQDACPAGAITYGNVMDETSKIAKAAHDERAYRALDSHLQTKPGVSYLQRVVLDEDHG